LLSFDQRGFSAQEKKCKLECKLESRHTRMSDLELLFTHEDLNGYLNLRASGLTPKSVTWLKKSAELLWKATGGIVSMITVRHLRDHVLKKYQDTDAQRKVLQFARAFLRYLSKISFDQRYAAFDLFLELPRAVKQRKHVTSRIVTQDDIENVLLMLEKSYASGRLDESHYLNCKALTLFGAFTGQRPLATIARLTIGQFREAVNQEKPFLNVLPEQDKIRMQHYCPLHPQVVEAILPLLENPRDSERVFEQLSFQEWLKRTDISLVHGGARIVNGDLRKFCEQQADIIQWDQSNKNYILTHGVSGVDWRFYKHPLPEHVYDIYMKYWGAITLKS